MGICRNSRIICASTSFLRFSETWLFLSRRHNLIRILIRVSNNYISIELDQSRWEAIFAAIGRPGNMSFVPRGIIVWCFLTIYLQDSITDSLVTGEITTKEHCFSDAVMYYVAIRDWGMPLWFMRCSRMRRLGCLPRVGTRRVIASWLSGRGESVLVFLSVWSGMHHACSCQLLKPRVAGPPQGCQRYQTIHMRGGLLSIVVMRWDFVQGPFVWLQILAEEAWQALQTPVSFVGGISCSQGLRQGQCPENGPRYAVF